MTTIFNPPMSTQRYCWVQDFIKQEQSIKSVTDIGCSFGRMVIWLKHISNLELINCVDKDLDTIEQGLEHNFQPNLFEMLFGRKNSENRLDIKVYHGDVVVPDDRLMADCFTMVELIEHIPLDHLERVCQTVFGYYKPTYIIVTTPNAEFNPLIQFHADIKRELVRLKEQLDHLRAQEEINQQQIQTTLDEIENLQAKMNSPSLSELSQSAPRFRHYDHKFEWTRAEFNHWGNLMSKTYSYDVHISGVGELPRSEPFGPCTQIALFKRRDDREATPSISTMNDPTMCFDLLLNKLSVQEYDPEFMGDPTLRRVCLRAHYHIPGTPATNNNETNLTSTWSDTQEEEMSANEWSLQPPVEKEQVDWW